MSAIPYRLKPGCTVTDYIDAVQGTEDSQLAQEWSDKPHRLVYDLCGEVQAQDAEIARLRTSSVELLAAAKKGRDVILETEGRGGRHEVILTQIETAISNAEKGT